ncbi:DUF6702 family protein [Flavobacterium sp.]|uniref:DUF6702 family protein n=1 Tax=Flavobacterium sp. TaxID=239 RepID=UPI002633D373|nr:DUF6702 family protein [Flavobacterium sp.]MDD2985182.1 hypothetical protein [Flavobacterium sp.]
MSIRKKLIIPILVLLTIGLASFSVHKFYVSVTQIDFIPEKKRIEVTARFFIDDLNNALENKYKAKFYLGSERETEIQKEQLKQYLSTHFSIRVNGKPKTMQFVQKEMEDDVLICYLKIIDISKINTLEVKNTLLFEVLPEQQHITHTKVLNIKKSILLTDDNSSELLKY